MRLTHINMHTHTHTHTRRERLRDTGQEKSNLKSLQTNNKVHPMTIYGHHRVIMLIVCLPPPLTDPRHCVRRAGELELLANSLSESVKDKSVALVHQKRTNK